MSEGLDGPRAVRMNEMPSLMRLVDTVFMNGEPGMMAGLFPYFFSLDNMENLFVMVRGRRVAAHAGLALCWADVSGCHLRVAMLGSVATAPPFRGQGMATAVVNAALARARAAGADLLMISGDRSLYRRIGARPAGCEAETVLTPEITGRLRRGGVALLPARTTDLPLCAAAYETTPAYFLRSMSWWRNQIRVRAAARGKRMFHCAWDDNGFAGYAGVDKGRGGRPGLVMEFGGDPAALCGTLDTVLRKSGGAGLTLRLVPHQALLRQRLEHAGAEFRPAPVDGTQMVVDFTRIMSRLTPLIARRAGEEAARAMEVRESEEVCALRLLGELATFSRPDAAGLLFGGPEPVAMPRAWRRVFPLPALSYGLNYV